MRRCVRILQTVLPEVDRRLSNAKYTTAQSTVAGSDLVGASVRPCLLSQTLSCAQRPSPKHASWLS